MNETPEIMQTGLTLDPCQAEQILTSWLGDEVVCSQTERLQGGMINTVLRLSFNRPPYQAVIKLNSIQVNFRGEAMALDYLRSQTRFPCPGVYLEDNSGEKVPFSFLLMENLPGENLAQVQLDKSDFEGLERQLAETLIELHSHTGPAFGPVDGALSSHHWKDIFLPQLKSVRGEPEVIQRLPAKVLEQVDQAIHAADNVFNDQGIPTLIHGDIWAGNIIVQRNKDHWRLSGLVDPGLQFADVEMELAYLESFNNPRPVFFQTYTQSMPLRDGYELRRMFYWLNTYLIHVWLFGDENYRQLAQETAQAIAQQV